MLGDAIIFLAIMLLLLGGTHAVLVARGVRQGLGFWCWLAATTMGVLGLAWSSQQEDAAKALMRDYARELCPTFALGLVDRGYLGLSLDTPPTDPTYRHLLHTQEQWLTFNREIADIYTLMPTSDGRLALLVDSDTDYNHNGRIDPPLEVGCAIGKIYPNPTPAMRDALKGVPSFDAEPYTDEWGTWVTATYPIFRMDGTVHSILGVDIDAHAWTQQTAFRRRKAIAGAGLLVMLVISAGLLVALTRQSVEHERAGRALVESRQAAIDQVARAKSQFLATISHEIRTPLTAILGFSELLHARDLDENDRYAYANTIHRNAEHLLELINDILDLSKIEVGRMTIAPQPTDLRLLLADVVELLRWRAGEKGVHLASEFASGMPQWVLVDALRVRQILVNIVGNAVKFTEEGGVRVLVSEGDPGQLRIDVIDTGVGIPPEVLPALFDRFQQGDASMSRRFGGTGLGLAISRKLARMMSGDIVVQSAPGEGSTFTITLHAPACAAPQGERLTRGPVAVAPPAPEPVAQLQPALATISTSAGTIAGASATNLPLTGLRIVYAEDGPDNQRLISLLLRKAGAQVTVVEHGLLLVDSMIRATREGQAFDLVLTDMQMPEMDGYAATRRLRELGFTTPILALTAHAMSGEKEKCLAAGCSGFLTKPIDRTTLVNACANAVAQPRKQAA